MVDVLSLNKKYYDPILEVSLYKIKRVQVSSLIEYSMINNKISDCVSTYNLSMHHIDVK